MEYHSETRQRRSIRLPQFDYSSSGAYFITLCTHNRECLFGQIVNGKMELNDVGGIARDEWVRTSIIRPNIQMDEFVIMPNHMHGIIIIREIVNYSDAHCRGTLYCRGTLQRAPAEPITSKMEKFGNPLPNTIPTIIRGYKSTVTNRINTMHRNPGHPVWQRNYYERIIRNEREFMHVREYISNNPMNWKIDKYYA